MKHFSETSPAAEKVVDAAEGLVQQHGYNGFSYDDIARLIGIKKPGIHHHFPTKAELVTVVAQRYTHRFRERLLRIDGTHAKAADKLAAYADLFAQTYAQDRRLCVCGMLGAEADALPPAVAAEVTVFFRSNLDWLTQVVQQGQASGQFHSQTDAKTHAFVFLSVLEGAMLVGRGLEAEAGEVGPQTAATSLINSLRA
ncbi:MAG: TetR/AcrR family transcriptional regulator [Burkholderiaceae bacterium]